MNKLRLTKRDRHILRLVSRYRIGTVDLLSQQVFTPMDSRKNIGRVLRRLQQHKLLAKESWDRGLSYFTLTSRGCQAIGLPARTPRLLTEQSLPTVLSVAFYCVRHGEERLTCPEFIELYPNLWTPGMQSSSYLLVNSSEDLKLEMLLVDRGGAPRRIRSRVRRAIAQRSVVPDFVSLMQIGRFQLNVLTGTEKQRDKILRQVEKDSFDPVHVVAHVVPELAEILLLRK